MTTHNKGAMTDERIIGAAISHKVLNRNGLGEIINGFGLPENTIAFARALLAAQPAQAGYSIRHVDGRWRTLDSSGMPDWTDEQAKALCFSLQAHADLYAQDDPEDVRIIEVAWSAKP